jgi:hypothetical protein
MRKKLQEKLFEKYPSLFKQRFLSGRETRMCDGFTCGDGWYDIIDGLCAKIMELDPDTEAFQVKEKFGGLRFYVTTHQAGEKVREAIGLAERKSEKTCENCGKPADERFRSDEGWVWTVCSNACKEKLRQGA